MPVPLLLDTCALIWSMSGAKMTDQAIAAIKAAGPEAVVYVSPISMWEVGLLIARRRVAFSVDQWCETLQAQSGIAFAEMSTEVLIRSSFLPGNPPNDPADRIIIASAREHGYRIVTRDRKILDYARQGHAAWMLC